MALDSLIAWIEKAQQRGAERLELRARSAAAPLEVYSLRKGDDGANVAQQIDEARREDYEEQGYTAEAVYVVTARDASGAAIAEKARTMRPAAPLPERPREDLSAPLVGELMSHNRAMTGMVLEQARDTTAMLRAALADKERTIQALTARLNELEGVAVERMRIEAHAAEAIAKHQAKGAAGLAKTAAIREAVSGISSIARPMLGAALASGGKPDEGIAQILGSFRAEQMDRLRAVVPGSFLLAMVRHDTAEIVRAFREDPELFERVGGVLDNVQLAALAAWWDAQPSATEPEGTTV